MACVEERSKKGKMGEGRETTDTKTTGGGGPCSRPIYHCISSFRSFFS